MLTCTTCHEEKPESEFSKQPKKTRGYSFKCKSCVSIYSKTHYKENRARYREQQERRRLGNVDRVDEIRKNTPCTVCGETRFYLLQFHHPNDDKEFSVGGHMNYSWERLQAEIDKCIVMCSNCHIEHHYKERTIQWA